MEENNSKPREINVLTPSPEKSIPKLRTGMSVNGISDGNIIISFFSQSPSSSKDAPNRAPLVLIETIVINKDGAKRFADALKAIDLMPQSPNE